MAGGYAGTRSPASRGFFRRFSLAVRALLPVPVRPAHSDLGDATNVTTLRVEWPSGIVQELQNVPAKQILTINEPARWVPLGPREFQIRCWKGMKFGAEKSPDLRTCASLGMVTNETGTLVFQDTQGDPQTGGCFYRFVSR